MTQQRRYYVLITSLVLSFSTYKGYAQWSSDGKHTIHEVGISTPYCATIDADACALCNSKDKTNCAPDNECNNQTMLYYNDGDYLESGDSYEPGWYICKESGWVHSDYEPKSCDPNTCNPSAWTPYNAISETRTNAWCEATLGGSTCMRQTQYRCIKNYYCAGSSCTSNLCTVCPSSPDYVANEKGASAGYKVKGMTQYPGATSISECYIPDTGGSGGYGYIDNTGVYKFIKECFYE